jgi:hypothetical protein
VQVLWNPDSFNLSATIGNNWGLISTWDNSYRRATNQTYLETQEIQ